ncbi:MAG TPA: glycerate kinase [Bacteroidales bacterium]|nr:glycerate kinase [Bacteroidales bacterium]
MKILICPDKFKESLTAEKVAESIKIGILKDWKHAECTIMPMADGGEGTVSAIVAATKGKTEKLTVHDPLMRPVDAFYGISGDGKTAVIEMAAASGLALVKPEERNPMITTSYGTGELIQNAIDKGCESIIIGIGGSATVDGGVGMAQAMRIRFLDENGHEIKPGGGNLRSVKHIDMSGIDKRIAKCKITVACDVTNVLTGREGAAYVFGPQKGATQEQVKVLDDSLVYLSNLIRRQINIDISSVSGGGAAGGMGAGIVAFLGGEIKKGFEVISEIVKLEEYIKSSDLIITGEGKIDGQTAYGKTPAGIAGIAIKYNKPVIAFAGALGAGYEKLYENGFSAIIPIADRPMSLEESMKVTGVLLEEAASRMIKVMGIGRKIKNYL